MQLQIYELLSEFKQLFYFLSTKLMGHCREEKWIF